MNDVIMCITTAVELQDLQNFCILGLVRRMNPQEQAALFELVAYKCRVLSAKGSRENKPQSAARKRAADCYRDRRDQRSATGSYAGAVVQPPLTLVRADATSYCLQLQKGAVLQHLVGPGGTTAPGPC